MRSYFCRGNERHVWLFYKDSMLVFFSFLFAALITNPRKTLLLLPNISFLFDFNLNPSWLFPKYQSSKYQNIFLSILMVTRKRHSFCYNFFPFLYLIAMCIIKWNKYTGLKNSKQRLYIFINHNIKSILKNTVWYGDNVGKRMYLKSWYY